MAKSKPLGPGTSTAREVDGSPVDNTKVEGFPVDNTNASLEGVLEEGYSEDEELGEEQLDFSCSEEDYPPPSSPAPVASDLPVSPSPVVPVPPACPKGATFTPSSPVQIGKAEARTEKKAYPASVAYKENVKDKGSIFTRLSPVVDSLVDDPPAAASLVESSPDATPPVDAPELDAPFVPSESCVAQDVQPHPQVTAASSEEWQTVHTRRNSLGIKRQPPRFVTRHLNVRFPPRGKLLSSQLISLPIRLPFVQLQVCSPGAQF
ncbi:hypothetical protein SADUNF_Sadunf03G0032800 [Salix dunnii]|uniref:Uncharacterized protein n=1 Tax=Salix dunnii TaxID=1413687 RepID=A0A835KG09_9ROSI|nr:hypothetical protein SADUNF_Sadunf03G0032800 [Salix dunnii]